MCNLFEMKGGSATDTHALYLPQAIGFDRSPRLEMRAPVHLHDPRFALPFFWALTGTQTRLARKCRQCTKAKNDLPSVARFVFSNRCFTSITSSSRTVCPQDSLSHLEEIPNCRPTLFLQFGENTQHREEDDIRVDSQMRRQAVSQVCTGWVLITMSGRWCATTNNEEFFAARCEQQREKSAISSSMFSRVDARKPWLVL